MDFALVYLVNRAFYRLGDFFHHWYVDALRDLVHWFISLLEKLDRTLAIRITFRYLFQPLYKDYTIVGRTLGFIFRSFRIIVGGVVYLFFTILFLAIVAVWILLPPLVIIYIYAAYVR
jgi:hypothetical protein